MKKFLIIFGSIILFILSTGTMYKLMHWPGAGPLLVIGMFFFSVFFLPLFFIHRMIENKSALNIVTNIFGLFSTSLLFIGVLFKIMHWPGAGPMIVSGATFFTFPTLILYVIQQFKEYDRKFREFWRTVVLGVLVCVFLIFWGSSVTRNILFSYLKVEDATLEINKGLTEYNAFILGEIKQKHADDPVYSAAENIHAQTMKMTEDIENIKRELIRYTESDPHAVEDHWYISAKDNYDIPSHYLGTANSERGFELLNSLNLYRAELKNQMKRLPFADEDLMEGLGDLGIKTELRPEMTDGYNMAWNEGLFNQQVIVGTLSLLSGIQSEVLNAEFKCLKTISINDHQFNITVKLKILEGDSTGGVIKIIKNGAPDRTIHSEGIAYPVALDFNSNYLFECSKDGYITKTIFFDTNIPDGREKEEFAKFTVSVELHKKTGGEVADASKPVGGVKFDPESDDFQKVQH